ncbi:Capsule polysaccharide biosynthesis [Rhodopirellula maiorica SM1]|uniref:Capsule polysaccharide biosynthesis n=1 Tax=Rhodopirellula maiorica SM1 TaxID=1265738 RepID=M5RTP1_9BACT|nr:capsule polysaccharide biosynthesis [Rhodopirellula maiorica]EMI17314.1 Capsule polysaccharide biosynthesis [Rhodopirellula maiorica SM1]
MFTSFDQSRSAVAKQGPLNVVLFETQEASPHLETTLEIAQRHLDAGDNVTICFWYGELPYHEPWGPTDPSVRPGAAFDRGIKRLSSDVRVIDRLGLSELRKSELAKEAAEMPLSTIADLKLLRWRDLDLGMGVVSSLISRFKTPDLDLQKHNNIARDAIRAFMLAYEASCAVYAENHFDLAYFFNGRFCSTRAILGATQNNQIEFRIQERGCDPSHYCLLTNVPHDRVRLQRNILKFWDQHSEEYRQQQAEAFYDGRRKGGSHGWPSFTSHQDQGVPQTLRSTRYLLSYFCGSDDENVAIGDAFAQQGFETQAEAVLALLDTIKSQPDCHLAIRVHPHLRSKSAESRYFWDHLPVSENVTVIAADSPINSYDLIDASDLVITYGSTVGVEASYYGKPVLLLGSSFYDQLNASHQAYTPETIRDFLSDPAQWTSHARAGSLKYGFYANKHGVPFEYYEPSDFFYGEFRGQNLFVEPPHATHHEAHGLPDRISRRTRKVFRSLLPKALRSPQ